MWPETCSGQRKEESGEEKGPEKSSGSFISTRQQSFWKV